MFFLLPRLESRWASFKPVSKIRAERLGELWSPFILARGVSGSKGSQRLRFADDNAFVLDEEDL